MTLEQQLQADQQRAHAYWMAKAASYEKPKAPLDWYAILDAIWFPAAMLTGLAFGIYLAWQPVIMHGIDAIWYAIFWTVFFIAFVTTGLIRTGSFSRQELRRR